LGQPTRSIVTRAIDESDRVRLTGETLPVANAANDRGRVADDFPLDHLLLQLRPPAEKEQELKQLIKEQLDAGSANYHKWLTPAEFRQEFSPAPEDVDAISRWLESHGFSVNVVYARTLDISGTAGQLREAFHTEIHHIEVRGEGHIANMSDPEVPAALAPLVVGFASLHDFRPQPLVHMVPSYTVTSGVPYRLAPADLATIYNFNPLFRVGITGVGQTIAFIEESDMINFSSHPNDWDTFVQTFGLSHYSGTLTEIHPQASDLVGFGNCNDPGVVSGPDVESSLDPEWAAAAAPGASLELASCADTNGTSGAYIALLNLIDPTYGSPPTIISISFASNEEGLANEIVANDYAQAVAEGIAIFAGSGDDGSSGIYGPPRAAYATDGIRVDGLASTPYNVAVGGTDFEDTFLHQNSVYWSSTNNALYGSAKSYIPEIPWNDSCASDLLAVNLGYRTTFGENGLCNATGLPQFSEILTTSGAGGGPSGCAVGLPSTSGVASGTCAGFPKPNWQSVPGNPNDGVRDIPDVSFFAAGGIWGHAYVMCFSDTSYTGLPCTGPPSTWALGGGTSNSTPVMAGVQALVNQKAGANQGFSAPVLYALAAKEYSGAGIVGCNSLLGKFAGDNCIFHNITQGNNDVPCLAGSPNCYAPSGQYGVLSLSGKFYEPAFQATPGWNFATGIGSVNVANLVNSWPSSSTAEPASMTIVSGTPQSSPVGTPFGAFFLDPLEVLVLDGAGKPVNGAVVTFTAPASGASVVWFSAGATTTATTNSQGIAMPNSPAANGVPGSYIVTASIGSLSANFSLTNTPAGIAPAITSPYQVTFIAGMPNSFAVTTTGSPTPFLSEIGPLPPGVEFTNDENGMGALTGNPPWWTRGTQFSITFKASNGVSPNAVQNFTLSVR
jgi:subtilase family serine protease